MAKALPDDVAAVLVRGIGAYIRAVPAAELPPKLKRFKRFDRPRALSPHRGALLGVVDGDDLTRARISEWMADGRPPLSKEEREVLALAVDRPDGWAEQLRARAKAEEPSPRSSPSPERGEGDLVARAKERTAKARQEARRARVDAEGAVKAAQERAAKLKAELDSMTAEAKGLRAALAEAEKKAASAERAAERAERKGRADRDRAAERERALREDLRAARRELRHEGDRLRREASKGNPARPRRADPEPAAPRRRRRLPVPKGRLATAPETLDEWLATEGVHLLVDGYNVTKAEGGFGGVDLAAQRRRVVEGVGKLARKKKITATIVFDGSDVPPGTSRRSRTPVSVEYSRPGETADDHLVARLESLEGVDVVVATNDKELQHRTAALGATVATSNQLLTLIR